MRCGPERQAGRRTSRGRCQHQRSGAHQVQSREKNIFGSEAEPGGGRSVGAFAGQGSHFARKSGLRSEEHTSELKSIMRTSYAVFCLKKKTIKKVQRKLYSSNTT